MIGVVTFVVLVLLSAFSVLLPVVVLVVVVVVPHMLRPVGPYQLLFDVWLCLLLRLLKPIFLILSSRKY